MIIPSNYTPIQITVTDDNQCSSIYYIWQDIYLANRDIYSYVSYISLARTYNLIYSLIKTDKLNFLNYPYTVVPTSSAENIEFYKLNYFSELILKEENNIKEIIAFDGSQKWYKNGKLHRDKDLPALILSDRRQEWFTDGLRHRDNDLPAIIHPDGTQKWYQNNQSHRDNDLPAIIHADGTQEWYKDGLIHRDNDLPAIIYTSGSKQWYKNGLRYDNPS